MILILKLQNSINQCFVLVVVGNLWGECECWGGELVVVGNLWGECECWGGELVVVSNLWGECECWGGELVVVSNLWGECECWGGEQIRCVFLYERDIMYSIYCNRYLIVLLYEISVI